MTFGDSVRFFREKIGYTQQELAEKSGYKHKSSIDKIESDLNDVPYSKIVELAKALETTPANLLGAVDCQYTQKQQELANMVMQLDDDNIDLISKLIKPMIHRHYHQQRDPENK